VNKHDEDDDQDSGSESEEESKESGNRKAAARAPAPPVATRGRGKAGAKAVTDDKVNKHDEDDDSESESEADDELPKKTLAEKGKSQKVFDDKGALGSRSKSVAGTALSAATTTSLKRNGKFSNKSDFDFASGSESDEGPPPSQTFLDEEEPKPKAATLLKLPSKNRVQAASRASKETKTFGRNKGRAIEADSGPKTVQGSKPSRKIQPLRSGRDEFVAEDRMDEDEADEAQDKLQVVTKTPAASKFLLPDSVLTRKAAHTNKDPWEMDESDDEGEFGHKELGTSQKAIAAAKKLGEKSAPKGKAKGGQGAVTANKAVETLTGWGAKPKKGKVSAASSSGTKEASARVGKAGASKFKVPAKERPPAEGGQKWKDAMKRLDRKTIPVLQRMLRFFKETHKSKATKKKDLKEFVVRSGYYRADEDSLPDKLNDWPAEEDEESSCLSSPCSSRGDDDSIDNPAEDDYESSWSGSKSPVKAPTASKGRSAVEAMDTDSESESDVEDKGTMLLNKIYGSKKSSREVAEEQTSKKRARPTVVANDPTGGGSDSESDEGDEAPLELKAKPKMYGGKAAAQKSKRDDDVRKKDIEARKLEIKVAEEKKGKTEAKAAEAKKAAEKHAEAKKAAEKAVEAKKAAEKAAEAKKAAEKAAEAKKAAEKAAEAKKAAEKAAEAKKAAEKAAEAKKAAEKAAEAKKAAETKKAAGKKAEEEKANKALRSAKDAKDVEAKDQGTKRKAASKAKDQCNRPGTVPPLPLMTSAGSSLDKTRRAYVRNSANTSGTTSAPDESSEAEDEAPFSAGSDGGWDDGNGSEVALDPTKRLIFSAVKTSAAAEQQTGRESKYQPTETALKATKGESRAKSAATADGAKNRSSKGDARHVAKTTTFDLGSSDDSDNDEVDSPEKCSRQWPSFAAKASPAESAVSSAFSQDDDGDDYGSQSQELGETTFEASDIGSESEEDEEEEGDADATLMFLVSSMAKLSEDKENRQKRKTIIASRKADCAQIENVLSQWQSHMLAQKKAEQEKLAEEIAEEQKRFEDIHEELAAHVEEWNQQVVIYRDESLKRKGDFEGIMEEKEALEESWIQDETQLKKRIRSKGKCSLEEFGRSQKRGSSKKQKVSEKHYFEL